MKEITFVTSNDNKVREAEQVLGMELNREKLDLDELQSMDLAPIIEHKARQAYNLVKRPIIVEDVGLYLDAWDGFPGPFVKWVYERIGYDVFPTLIPSDNRKVTWVVVYGYCDGETFKTFEGRVEGTIAAEKRGTDGWGFDPLFIPAGLDKTYAELGSVEKLKYSARQQALLKVKKYLVSR